MVWDCPDPEQRLERAIDLFHEGRVARAEADLSALEAVGYRSAEVLLYLGHCALARERLLNALGWYREARRAASDRPEIYVGLAVVAARRLHFRRAIRLLRRAEGLPPPMPEVFDNLILCHAALGEHAAAEAAFRGSLALDRSSPHPYYNAGFVHFDRGDPKKARALWLKVLEMEPSYPDAARLVASCERVLGQLPAARRRLERLVKKEPRDVAALAELGLVHENRMEWQSAVHAYGRVLEIDPGHASVRARRGVLLRRHGRKDDGLRDLRRAGREDPADPDIAEPLACALLETGDPAAAWKATRAAVRAEPDEADARIARARVLERAGRHGRAAAEYARACRLEPDRPAYVCSLAQALVAAGATGRAVRLLEDARQRFPDDPAPCGLLAEVALGRGEAGAAIELCERGLVTRPDDPRLLTTLAEAYLHREEFARAISFASRARRSEVMPGKSLDVLGRTYLALGDTRRAMDLATTLLSECPDDPRGLALRGRASLAAGNPDAAVGDLRLYVRARPGDAAGYSDLARCLDVLGQGEAARTQERIAAYVARAP